MPDEATTTDTTDATQTTDTRDATSDESPEKLLAALRTERDARKALEKEVKPLRQFHKERTDAEKTADERLAAREQAVKDQEQRITARLQASILRDEIASAVNAEKITLHAPIGDVLRLLDTGAVEWDGETPKNVRALLKELVKERPYLASRRTGSADAGAGDGRSTGHTMNDLIRAAAGRDR
jgi:hypothetical protein